jgi:endonuclease G
MKLKFIPVLLLLFFNHVYSFSQDKDYLPGCVNGILVNHLFYTLSYCEKAEQAEWVAYDLSREEVYGKQQRTNNFREDPLVKTGSANLSDYKYSGFDRGHLAPAGDMKFSKTAMSESFFLSNMSPQRPAFNRGGWKNLESLFRSFAIKYGHIYIITGPVLSNDLQSIGPDSVAVPLFYYKIALDYSSSPVKTIAFLMPNKKINKDLFAYVCTVDSLETLTGIDFFSQLPNSIENKIESNHDYSKWK